MKTKIFQIGYRETTEPYWSDGLYDAVQVGTGATFLPHRDTECEGSIAEWNPIYCETTGMYWIWKEGSKDLDIVGQCQYRRRLKFDDAGEVEKIFNSYDCIAPVPLNGVPVWKQYAYCHDEEDLIIAESVIREKYPEYLDPWNTFIRNGRVLFYSASFVMRKEDFNDYCSFFFGFAEEFLKRKGWDTVEKALEAVGNGIAAGKRGKARGRGYQAFVLGFLNERLLTMFILSRFKADRIRTVPYYKLEGV